MDISCTTRADAGFPHIAKFWLARRRWVRQSGGMNRGSNVRHIPEWVPRSFAPVCLLTGVPALRDQIIGIVAAAGAELIDELPAGGAVSAILIGSDVLAERTANPGLRQRRGCPRLLVGAPGDERTDLWQLAADDGIDHVVPLPEGAIWLAEFLNGLQTGPELGRAVAVIGGCGGAGASTTAALLALRSVAQGHRTLLVDGDPWGAGIEYFLESEPPAGLTWFDLQQSAGTLSPIQFAAALPHLAGCSVLGFGPVPVGIGETPSSWRAELPPDVIASVLEAALRAFEIVIIDVARSAELLQLFSHRVDILICQSTAGLTGVLAVRKLVPALPTTVQLVVRGPCPEGVDAELVAESLGLPLLGEVPHLRNVGRFADRGALAELTNRRGVRRLFEGLLRTLEKAGR